MKERTSMSRWTAAKWVTGDDFERYEIKVRRDGDRWCALIGVDQMVGLAGFGTTPVEALLELVAEIYEASGSLEPAVEARLRELERDPTEV